MSSPSPDRKALEEFWLNRLHDAKLRLTFTRNYLIEVKQDFSSPEIPAADGNFAYRQALQAENVALSEYQRILRIFSDLTLRGIIPDETPWCEGGAHDRATK